MFLSTSGDSGPFQSFEEAFKVFPTWKPIAVEHTHNEGWDLHALKTETTKNKFHPIITSSERVSASPALTTRSTKVEKLGSPEATAAMFPVGMGWMTSSMTWTMPLLAGTSALMTY